MIKYRNYGSTTIPSVIGPDGFDQDNDEYSQIFGFVLSGKLELNLKTLLDKFVEFVYQTGDVLSPNIVVTLNDGVLRPHSKEKNETLFSAQTASDFAYFPTNTSFRLLIRWIQLAYRFCKTIDSDVFDRYFIQSDPPGGYGISKPKKVDG